MNVNSIILLFILFTNSGFAKQVPSDSTIQSIIFEYCREKNREFQCQGLGDSQCKSSFQISFKMIVVLAGEEYLFVVSSAFVGEKHGHKFGCKSYALSMEY